LRGRHWLRLLHGRMMMMMMMMMMMGDDDDNNKFLFIDMLVCSVVANCITSIM
jgi:hypothetical protein